MSNAIAGDRASGDFERYGLVAALTLVVLCLLLADRIRTAPRAVTPPPADRLLRVRIGGRDPATAGPPARGAGTPARGDAGAARRIQPIGDGATEGTPPSAGRAAAHPPPAVSRTCVVGDGETLGDIALRELGTSKRAREIADLNGIADAHRIRAGQTIRLPAR